MNQQSAPKGLRLHIAFFGRRNVGKSSLLNAITCQNVSIVSNVAGTTTDPVEKPMELLPFGPVVFIDTAGLDDDSTLGAQRTEKTHKVFERTELATLVTDGTWGAFEDEILTTLREKNIPFIVALNKSDLQEPSSALCQKLEAEKIPYVKTSAAQLKGIDDFRQLLLSVAPEAQIETPAILGDLVSSGELAILVVPIDKEAPKGRLILPQVQTIRDLLDSDALTMVVKERELKHALEQLKNPPKIIVTDSQAFLKVAADTPNDVAMTSFSILFSRAKGDLVAQTEGVKIIDQLKSGDKILIAESCTHHPICEDIGRVKIPRWLTQYAGGKLDVTVVQGQDFPTDLTPYKLVVHCGACMFNRRAMLSRILLCQQQNVPITNYGLAIAHCLGILERALRPFPAAHATYTKK